MTTFKSLCAGLALCGASAVAFAAANPLSVHVLNLQDGLPSTGVKVLLEKQSGKDWTPLSTGITNEQGRIPALYPEGQTLEKGNYRVTFKTGDWFTAHKTASFFPEVPVIFAVDGTVPHYHIPLLVSPYGFSTYRGN
ncbi:MAG: hydroxyisourate hydrolase [Burkholderiaceae bacterium]|nr:hydroxyisourate hydrolase [Burkholderiaceae bacterium]